MTQAGYTAASYEAATSTWNIGVAKLSTLFDVFLLPTNWDFPPILFSIPHELTVTRVWVNTNSSRAITNFETSWTCLSSLTSLRLRLPT